MSAETLPGFAELLRRHRLAAGLSQEELAERAEMSLRGISDLERGLRTRPRRETLRLLARALSLGADEAERFDAVGRGRPLPEPTVVVPHRLPSPVTRLIGREREHSSLVAMLSYPECRLVTLTGPGGVGKTRLAISVAHRFVSDTGIPAAFVPLASVSRPDLVLPAVAGVLDLGVRLRSALDALAAHIDDRPVLLVLDNLEHVVAAAPDIAALLERCPALTVLITSRIPAHIRGEHRTELLPLPLPDTGRTVKTETALLSPAVTLFLERVREQQPGFRITRDTAGTVVDICRRLDGLPLALELAAARMRVLTPHELLERLNPGLNLLTDGPVDMHPRQQTMRATVDWSVHLLSPALRVLLAQLSVFRGGWTLEAAEAVCGGTSGEDVLDGIASLADAALILRTDDGAGTSRFTMLETVREYAAEHLTEEGRTHEQQKRHAQYFASLVRRAGEDETRRPPSRYDMDNVRVAFQWLRENDMHIALILGSMLTRFWGYGLNWKDHSDWIEDVRIHHFILPEAERAQVLESAANTDLAGTIDEAIRLQWYEESQTLRRGLGDRAAAADAVALAAWRALEDRDMAAANRLFDDGRLLLRDAGDGRLKESGLKRLILVGERLGRFSDATKLTEEGLRLAERRGDEHDVAARTGDLGDLALLSGDLHAARAHYSRSLQIRERIQDWNCAVHSLAGLTYVALASGDWDRARELLDRRSSLTEGTESGARIAQSANLLGHTLLLLGATERAAESFRESLQRGVTAGDGVVAAESLLGLAGVAAREGQAERTARLAAAAGSFGATLAHPVSLINCQAVAELVRPARGQLSEAAWDAAWCAGMRMTQDEAIADAMASEPDLRSGTG